MNETTESCDLRLMMTNATETVTATNTTTGDDGIVTGQEQLDSQVEQAETVDTSLQNSTLNEFYYTNEVKEALIKDGKIQ